MALFKSLLSLVALRLVFAGTVIRPSRRGSLEGKAIGSSSLQHVGFPKFPAFGTGPHKQGLPSNCGHRHVIHATPNEPLNEPLMKVVGGAPALYGAYPWTVHIESLSYEGFEHGCGGTLVSDLFVITAAHCLHGYGSHEVRVKVGDYKSSKKDVAERIFEVEGWRVHPDFQKGGVYANDIAVLKIKPHLGRGVEFDEFVSPACLPSKEKTYPAGTMCLVSGWGLTHPDNFLPSDVLRAASVPLLPQSVCRRKDILGNANFRDGMICAGYLQGQIDACNGDSGGPLVCEINGHHTLVGVVSWGMECAKKNKPGIYSEVQFYLDFITAAMDEL